MYNKEVKITWKNIKLEYYLEVYCVYDRFRTTINIEQITSWVGAIFRNNSKLFVQRTHVFPK